LLRGTGGLRLLPRPMSPGVQQAAELLALTLARGSLYALVAVGFAVVFGAGRVLNLFHGSFYLLGAYAAVFLAQLAAGFGNGPVVMALVSSLAALAVGALGYVYFVLFLSRSARRPIRLLVIGVVANLFVAMLVRSAYGTRGSYLAPIVPGTLAIGNARILKQEVVIAGVAAALFPALWWLLRHTRVGTAIRAVAEDVKGARLVGIQPERLLGVTVALAALLAGLAGALVAPVRVISPDMWTFALLKSFTVVLLGGVGSLMGTVTTAYALGALEILGTAWIGESGAEFFGVLVALLALALRPKGVFEEA
jgi:branched-chain amino acid transport system permease protein